MEVKLNLRVKLRWWLKPILKTVIIVNAFTGWAPSEQRMDRLISLGLKVQVPERNA